MSAPVDPTNNPSGLSEGGIGDKSARSRTSLAEPRMVNCRRCDKPFEPRSYNHVWCSGSCRRLACDETHRAACPECGKPMGKGSGFRSHRPARCDECERKHLHRQHDRRAEAIVEMWQDGFLVREIADELDSTPNAIGVDIIRLRKAGWDLPYRNRRGGQNRNQRDMAWRRKREETDG